MCIFGARPLATLEQAPDAPPKDTPAPSAEFRGRERLCDDCLEAQPEAELELARTAAAERRVVIADIRCRLRLAELCGRAEGQIAARSIQRGIGVARVVQDVEGLDAKLGGE